MSTTNPAVLASTLTDKSLTVLIGVPPKPYTIDREHPRFAAVTAAVGDPAVSEEDLVELFAPATAYERIVANSALITVADGVLLFDGEPVNSHLATRLKDAHDAGFSTDSWENLARNAALNPLPYVIDELCEWLEAGKMPVSGDGFVFGFKYVDYEYKSLHADTDGTRYDHTPGNIVEMARDRCDTDRSKGCSTGLHFCSLDYLQHASSGHKIVLVKVNPADVTSFPTDSNLQKGRTCRYEVVADVTDQYQHLAANFPPVVTDYDEPETPAATEAEPEAPASDETPVVTSPVVGAITPTDFTRLLEENGGKQSGVAKRYGVSTGTVAAWKRKLFGGAK